MAASLLPGRGLPSHAPARDPSRGSGALQKTAASPAPRGASAYFDDGFLRRSAEYNRAKIAFALNARAIRWAAYLTLAFTPFLARVGERLARRFPGRDNTRAFVLAWATILIAFCAVLPVSLASGFWHEHRYGLSRQSLAAWLFDALKALLISGLVTSLLTVLYFFLRRRVRRHGWAVLAGAAVAATVLATLVYPVVVDPLFYRFRPLQDPALRRDLVEMAGKEGIRIHRVLVMEASAKTVRENAYFTGLGRTKRVVLWDNLLANASPAQVRQIFAHELGHWSRGHIVRGLALSVAAIPLLCWVIWQVHGRAARSERFGLRRHEDPVGTPLLYLLLSLALFAAQPVENAISRSFEREADRVSLDLTRDPETFIEGERRLAVTNLNWVDPPAVWKWLFWSHPTTLERIRMAESWAPSGTGGP